MENLPSRSVLTLIFVLFLLVEKGLAQPGNTPRDPNAMLMHQDSAYQNVAVVDQLPIFLSSAKERLIFPLSWLSGSFTDFDSWRAEARRSVQQLLLSPPPAAPFTPYIMDHQDRGSYVAHKIALNISGDARVLGYLLIPKEPGPHPAVLLLHDHGAKFDIGKEKMVQPFNDTPERNSSAEAWKNKLYGDRFIGDVLARRGYICFVTDALNWGDRGGAGYDGHQALASYLFLLGISYSGLIAWEDIAAARFLATLPEVDSDRVAALGFSLGSFRAWQVAALSDDIKAAVCICWMATIKGLMVNGNNHTRRQSAFTTTHPGLANFLDYPDVASMACPKPMLFYNGEMDRLFPALAVQEAYGKLRAVWKSQHAEDRLATQFWASGHEFSIEMQEQAFRWLNQHMKKRKASK